MSSLSSQSIKEMYSQRQSILVQIIQTENINTSLNKENKYHISGHNHTINSR